jgi:hypothetical protein
MKLRILLLTAFLVSAGSAMRGQQGFPVTLPWPTADKPTLNFSLAKLQQAGLYNGQTIYVSDVTVQNVSDQPVPKSVFTIFLNDKDGVRIGRGLLRLPEIRPAQSEKAQLQFSTAGTPAAAELLIGRTIRLKVTSTPPGANFKIDGHDSGTTPRIADLTVGMHTIELSKEGYATATSPLEVSGDEVEGGGIQFELGSMSNDTIQLRDGTVVVGDVISLSMTTVVMHVDGKEQKYDRNQVKKILLVERLTTQPAGQHETAKPH